MTLFNMPTSGRKSHRDFSADSFLQHDGAAWETKTDLILVELDSIDDDGDELSLFFDRENKSYLIVRNPKFVTRQRSYETLTYLTGEQEGRYSSAKDAFTRWLELLG